MVDLANPFSMHQAMSTRPSLTGPGPFSHSSNNPHMYGDSRSMIGSRASPLVRYSGLGSYRPAGHSRNGSWDGSSQVNGGTYKYSLPPHGGTRSNDSAALATGRRPDLMTSYHGSGYDMNISRLVEKEMDQKVERTQNQAPSPGSRRPSQAPAEPSSHRRQSSSGHSIVPSLQIPATINDSKGSLAEFAAQVRIYPRIRLILVSPPF